jgi:hypothetical protein
MTAQTFSDIPPSAIGQRDRLLLAWLAAVKLASESQLARHFWPQTRAAPARRRLKQLTNKYRLLAAVEVDPEAMTAWGLIPGPVFELSPLGRDWLQKVAGGEPGYQSKPPQYLHDLLVTEISVRLAEAAHRRGPGWSSDWFGEPAIRPFAPPGLLPDGLGLLRRPDGAAALAFFLELDASRESHGRPSSQIGRKIHDYDQYAAAWERRPGPVLLPQFPPVLVITHGAERLKNLAAALRQHRRRPVAYGLALLDDLLVASDVLTTPAWRLLPANDPQPDLLGQPLLNQSDWQTLPARKIAIPPPPKPPTSAPRPVSHPSSSQPITPSLHPASPPPKALTPTAVRPASLRPVKPAPVPRPVSPPPTKPAIPPAPASDSPPSTLLHSGQFFWLILLIFIAIIFISTTSHNPLSSLRDWLYATATPIPTATPDPFEHFPTATPYGRSSYSIQPE